MVGTAADNVDCIWSHNDVDIVVTPSRRSGKPTLAGTRLEPRLLAERVFQVSVQFLPSLTAGGISWAATEDILGWFRAHPHSPPLVRPRDDEWFEQMSPVEITIEHEHVINRATRAYEYAVSEIAARREYTNAKHIDAMVRYYDAHHEDIERLRRLAYDSAAAVRKFGTETRGAVTVVGPEDEMEGAIFTENGEAYRSYSQFVEERRNQDEWPPSSVEYIDHEKTFGVVRPPGDLRLSPSDGTRWV